MKDNKDCFFLIDENNLLLPLCLKDAVIAMSKKKKIVLLNRKNVLKIAKKHLIPK